MMKPEDPHDRNDDATHSEAEPADMTDDPTTTFVFEPPTYIFDAGGA